MNAILLQDEAFEPNQEEFATVSTTFTNQKVQKFPQRPVAVVRSVSSVAQTSDEDFSTEAKSYYLSPRFPGFEIIFLLPRQPYQLRTIEVQPEEQRADDIAVYSLARSITGQNISFVQPSLRARRGKFVNSLLDSYPKTLPLSQSELSQVEVEDGLDDEHFWRGVFVVPHQPKILFYEDIEVKASENLTWKPHVVIDTYRLEDDDERSLV